ncbi:MAG: hypothetical protein WC852_01510 [Candidatus Nanoarchaeia archaeon]|jgi:hypothetical protein
MKKLLVILLALAVILTACAQKPAEITAPVETPVAETPVAETPAEEVPLTPAIEETETPAAPAEETPVVPLVEETTAETPKAETDEKTYEVAIGDKITYKDTTFLIDNIANSGNELYLNFNGFILKLKSLNKPEILDNVEYKITSNANFVRTHSVTLNVSPFKLEKNQYLIMKESAVIVNNTRLVLGDVKIDTYQQESAYFSVGGYEYWVKLKDTQIAGNLSVTLDQVFHQQRRYALLTIVPK